MARRLKNLVLDRVDLVDVGANQKAHIVLTKRLIKKDSPSVSSVHVDTAGSECDERDDYEKATLTSEQRNKLPDSAFAAVWTDAQGKKQRKLPYKHADGSVDHGHLTAALGRIDGTPMPDDVKASARRKLHAASGTKEKRMNAKEMLKNFVSFLKSSGAEGADEIEKDIMDGDADDAAKRKKKEEDAAAAEKRLKTDAELAKRMTDLEKRATDAEAIAKSERNLRLDAEMRTLLKSVRATPFNLDEAKEDNDIKKFRKMQDESPEAFSRMMEVMKATDDQLATSKAFETVGTSQIPVGSAESQLQKKAEELMTVNKSLTKEAAFAKACEDNPALTRKYRAEQH